MTVSHSMLMMHNTIICAIMIITMLLCVICRINVISLVQKVENTLEFIIQFLWFDLNIINDNFSTLLYQTYSIYIIEVFHFFYTSSRWLFSPFCCFSLVILQPIGEQLAPVYPLYNAQSYLTFLYVSVVLKMCKDLNFVMLLTKFQSNRIIINNWQW